MTNPHGVDFEAILLNAEQQGIDLSEISLFYSDLTDEELLELKRHNLFVDQSDKHVIGKFNKEGVALFGDKVAWVYSLSA